MFFAASTFETGTELWRTDGTAAGTRLVKDIDPGPESSGPSSLAVLDGAVLFVAVSPDTGLGLWRSDGTELGTQLVDQLGSATNVASGFTELDGRLYFILSGPEQSQLWRTDGTRTGTVAVAAFSSQPSSLINVEGTLFFRINGYGHVGQSLWKSDGTANGTVLVKTLNSGFDISIARFGSALVPLERDVVFVASSTFGAMVLWRSDGTETGTVPVHTFSSAFYARPTFLTKLGDAVFFIVPTPGADDSLWRSDGTDTGTVRVADIPTSSYTPMQLIAVGDLLFFDAVDPMHGDELWRSDGTAAGTMLVRDIHPGTEGSTPSEMTQLDGMLVFSADDGINGTELWRSDGTASGTELVQDISPGASSSTPFALTALGDGRLFFSAEDGTRGRELWRTDGTASGTMLVQNIAADDRSTVGASPSDLANVGGQLLFRADDGVHGSELWRSDGTPAGTVLVQDINPGPLGSWVDALTQIFGVFDGALYFWANDGAHGVELWKSDGTTAGTLLLKDIAPGPADSFANVIGEVDGTIYFSADDGSHGYELWKTDGTSDGTTMVADLNPGPDASYPAEVTKVNGTVFLRTVRAPLLNGGQLWRTDGTEAGTVLLRTFTGFYQVGNLVGIDGRLVFFADDGISGGEPWASDGTPEGTILLKDIAPGRADSFPAEFTEKDGELFFAAAGSLWKTDGTSAGTVIVAPIGSFDDWYCRSPFGLFVVGNTLFFRSCLIDRAAVSGTVLWMSDGTAAGTMPLKQITVGPVFNSVTDVANDVLIFLGYDIEHGGELWRSDGTPAGTGLLRDIDPGTASSYPALLRTVDGHVVFQACQSDRCAPWVTDGTPDGTRQLADLDDAGPFEVTRALLFFAAGDRFNGDELWAVPLAEVAPCLDCTPTPTATTTPAIATATATITATSIATVTAIAATPPPGSGGSGCAIGDDHDGGGEAFVVLLALALLTRARRRRLDAQSP